MVLDLVLLSKQQNFICWDFNVQIAFTPDQKHVFPRNVKFDQLLDPPGKVVKWLSVVKAETKANSICTWHYMISTFVVWFLDRSEPFLSCCIPKLSFHFKEAQIIGFDFEVDSNGSKVLFVENVFSLSGKKAGFADSHISSEDYFAEHVIIRLLSLVWDAWHKYKISMINSGRGLIYTLIFHWWWNLTV